MNFARVYFAFWWGDIVAAINFYKQARTDSRKMLAECRRTYYE